MSKSRTEDLIRFFLHDPAKTAQSYVHWAQLIQEQPGITYGCVLDETITPLRPGNAMGVLGRPGHGKSSMMIYWTNREARKIAQEGLKECCVYCGWDQIVEETEAGFQAIRGYTAEDLIWGRADMAAVRANAIPRASLPIFHIGYSIADTGQKRPPAPTIDDVYEMVQYIEYEMGLHVRLIALDYIQKVPVRPGMKRLDEVTEAMYKTKELLSRIGAAGLVGVQASRVTDTMKIPLPTMDQAQQSSAIEQELDKLISVLRPRKVFNTLEYPTIEINGVHYPNDDRLLLIKNLKQRFGKGYGIHAVSFDVTTMTLRDYDLKRIDVSNRNGREEPIPV